MKLLTLITILLLTIPASAADVHVQAHDVAFHPAGNDTMNISCENRTTDWSINDVNLFYWLTPIHTDLYYQIYDAAYARGSNEHDEAIIALSAAYLKNPTDTDPQQLHIAFCRGYIDGSKNSYINQTNNYDTVFSDGKTTIYW